MPTTSRNAINPLVKRKSCSTKEKEGVRERERGERERGGGGRSE